MANMEYDKGKLHMTDYSTASRTMLLNIHEGKWDQDIFKQTGNTGKDAGNNIFQYALRLHRTRVF